MLSSGNNRLLTANSMAVVGQRIRISLYVLSVVALLALSSSPIVLADAVTIGGTSSASYAGPGYIIASPIALPECNVQSIGVNWAATGPCDIRVALYSAGTDKPASLKVESATTAATSSTGWQDITVTETHVSSGTYWIALQVSTMKQLYYASGSRSFYQKSYGSFDSSWTSSSYQDSVVQFNMRVTYSTGPPPPPPSDFTISASPTSQSVGAGASASYTLTLTASSTYGGGTAGLSVTSGFPSGATGTITPNSVSLAASETKTATLSVSTSITTPGGTSSIVVTATDGTRTHTATVTLTVSAPASYSFNVKASATQIVVTLTYSWSGSGSPPSGSITIAGPGGTPTLGESGAVVYDRTSITVSESTSTYSIIHRATFTITAPGSAQTWTALISLSGVSNYNVAIEVS
jgi:hypothetical protein